MNATSTLPANTQAVEAGKLTAATGKNLECWLTEPRYAEYVPEIGQHPNYDGILEIVTKLSA